MNFLSQSERNLQDHLLSDPDSLEDKVLFECEVMVKYILDEGKTISEKLLVELKRIRAVDLDGTSTDEDKASITGIHARLCVIIKPAQPGTLAHLHEERETRGWLRFLGPIPFFRSMMFVSVVFLFSLVGLSLSKYINTENINKGIFDHSGVELLVNLLFLVTAAGLGAVFAALYEANQSLRNRTFNPDMTSSYWARLAMGLVAGIILAELVPIRPPGSAAAAPGDVAQHVVVAADTNQIITDSTRRDSNQLSEAEIRSKALQDSLLGINTGSRGDSKLSDTTKIDSPKVDSSNSVPASDTSSSGRGEVGAIGEANRGGVMKVLVAVLGGFSANLLFNILIKMGGALESVVGSGEDIMGRIQQLDRRIQERSHEAGEMDQNASEIREPEPPPVAPTKGASPPAPPKPATPGTPSPAIGPPAKMYVTMEQLKAMMPRAKESKLEAFLFPMNRALDRYEINTPLRIVHFIAQLGHESGDFRYTEEIWKNPQLDANGVATNGNKWQKSYEGRKGLGNIQTGDGYRFRGRGLIQLTGRNNYQRYNDYLQSSGYRLNQSLLDNPDQVAQPELAVDSAAWFWRKGRGPNLNTKADSDDVVRLTKLINGGTNGLDDRKKRLIQAKKGLGMV